MSVDDEAAAALPSSMRNAFAMSILEAPATPVTIELHFDGTAKQLHIHEEQRVFRPYATNLPS